MIGGVAELTVASSLMAIPGGQAGGLIIGFHGSDVLVAGLTQVISGTPTQSITSQGISAIYEATGTPHGQAVQNGEIIDGGISIIFTMGGSYSIMKYGTPTPGSGLREPTINWDEEAIPERNPNFQLPTGPHGTGIEPPSGITPRPGPITPGPGAHTIGGGDVTPPP